MNAETDFQLSTGLKLSNNKNAPILTIIHNDLLSHEPVVIP